MNQTDPSNAFHFTILAHYHLPSRVQLLIDIFHQCRFDAFYFCLLSPIIITNQQCVPIIFQLAAVTLQFNPNVQMTDNQTLKALILHFPPILRLNLKLLRTSHSSCCCNHSWVMGLTPVHCPECVKLCWMVSL